MQPFTHGIEELQNHKCEQVIDVDLDQSHILLNKSGMDNNPVEALPRITVQPLQTQSKGN